MSVKLTEGEYIMGKKNYTNPEMGLILVKPMYILANTQVLSGDDGPDDGPIVLPEDDLKSLD